MFENGSGQNGQTLPDFALAFGVFMIAITIAYSSTTVLFAPYQTTQERIGESDRIANRLVTTTLTAESEVPHRYVLEQDCVTSAFDAINGNSPTLHDKCDYTDDIDDVDYSTYLGLEEERGMRIAIIDADANVVTRDGVTLEAGGNVPEVAETTNAYRMVKIDGDLFRLRVTVW